ncbi:MAG: hypothetical protein IPH59_09695 [bacterium]|nr:hypothetical protein [bacterium]
MKEQFATRSRVVVRLLTAVIFSLLLSGCGLEAPQAPSWDTTLTIPLINRSYTSAELIEKLASDNIEIDEYGNSSFHIQRDLDTVTMESILSIDPIESNYSKQVGRIKIVSPSDQSQSLAFSDYVPLVLGSVPDTGISTVTVFGQASSFAHAEIDEGGLTITAVNNTGFELDSLAGQLINSQDGSVLANFVVPGGLADGQEYSQEYPLNDKSVGVQLNFEVYFHTEGGPALSLADRVINFTIDYSDEVYVKSVYGQLDAFSNEYSERTNLAEDVHLETGMFAGGTMDLAARNSLSIPVELTFEFPEITNNDVPLQVSYQLAAGGVLNQQVDLGGWTIQPNQDSILTVVQANVAGTGGNYATIDSEDEFEIEFGLNDIQLATARGVFEPTELAIENSEVAVDVPVGFDEVTLEFVELSITLSNYTNLSGDVAVNLQASNGKSLQVLGNVEARGDNSASITQIYSDQLADLLTPIPDHITVSGVATVGDGVTSVELTQDEYFSATAVISAPMAFKISQATVEGDKNKLTVDKDIAEGSDRLNHGNFKATMHNHLPLGAQMRVYIGTDSASLFTAPLTIIGPLSFDQATTDANGAATNEVVTNSEIELTKEDLLVFGNRNLYVATVLELAGSNGQTVRIRAADYMAISGVVQFTARVGGEE